MLRLDSSLPEYKSPNYLSPGRVALLRSLESELLYGFDRILIRMKSPPSEKLQEQLLDLCAKSCPAMRPVRVRKANGQLMMHMVALPSRKRGSKKKVLWVIVAPDAEALALIAEQDDWEIVEAELARDFLTPDIATAQALQLANDLAFIVPWPGKHYARSFYDRKTGNRTSYTDARKGRGRKFKAYVRESKFAQRPCFHQEAIVSGAAALARIGIHTPADLLTFRHREFWDDVDARCYFTFDPARLGRERRRQKGKRLPAAKVDYFGSLEIPYDFDMRGGCLVIRNITNFLNTSDADAGYRSDTEQGMHALQHVFNRFRLGPWLTRIENPVHALHSKSTVPVTATNHICTDNGFPHFTLPPISQEPVPACLH